MRFRLVDSSSTVTITVTMSITFDHELEQAKVSQREIVSVSGK